ncbi:hypothetical protein OHB12_14320 [Nocardia sp. NBC_01730]|uniref:hypothetical protein n=1 Tax=Nocardia sp. NBC_01730 TaxID=2975998 RepID=UPI002E109899|nr:hypothetical protein OHB12_14320 [Nocardia sp. NBC_01730]
MRHERPSFVTAELVRPEETAAARMRTDSRWEYRNQLDGDQSNTAGATPPAPVECPYLRAADRES